MPDFTRCNDDLDELIELSVSRGFDLFEFLRLLSEAGFPTLCCEVDYDATDNAFNAVCVYQLSEPVLRLLAALRTGDLNADEIEGTSTRRFARFFSHDVTMSKFAYSDFSQ
jgi:hypothetical protein